MDILFHCESSARKFGGISEDYILPAPAWYIREMPIRPWMNGMSPEQRRRTQKLVLEENEKELTRDYQLYLTLKSKFEEDRDDLY